MKLKKKKFCCHKVRVLLGHVDLAKVLVSKKISFG